MCDHQRARLPESNESVNDTLLAGISFCFFALCEDDEHGVGVVDEVEDSKAHVMAEKIMTLMDKVIPALTENWNSSIFVKNVQPKFVT